MGDLVVFGDTPGMRDIMIGIMTQNHIKRLVGLRIQAIPARRREYRRLLQLDDEFRIHNSRNLTGLRFLSF